MEIQELLLDKSRYRKTTKKRYDVTIKRPRTCTTIHNILDDSLQVTSSYKPFVIIGPCGEETIAGIGDLIGKYEFTDGSILTEEGLIEKLQRNPNGIQARWIASDKVYWASLIPYTLAHLIVGKLIINRQSILLQGMEQLYTDCLMAGIDSGDLSQLNKNYVGKIVTNANGSYYIPVHGRGDYLVCESLLNGEPDLSTAQVINGVQFEKMFDMRSFSTVALEIAFLLLDIYIQDMTANEGIQSNKLKSECTTSVRKESYLIKIGERQGKICLDFNKSDRNLVGYYDIYGKKYSVSDYNTVRKGNVGRDEVDTLIYYVTSLISTFKKQLAIAKIELSEDMERLVTTLFSEVERVFKILPGEYTANPTIRADKSLLAVTHLSANCNKPIRILVIARVARQQFESAILFDGKEYELQQLTTVRNAEEAKVFVQEFRSMYVRMINGFASTKTVNSTRSLPVTEQKVPSQKATATQAKLTIPTIEDWYSFVTEEVVKGLKADYEGDIAYTDNKGNRFFTVNGQTVLVISKIGEAKIRVMNKTSNASLDLKDNTAKYLVTVARNCVKFSKS